MMSSSPSFHDVSALSKAAGEPLRLEVLRVLAQDSYGVLELCEIFQHKQSGMSHHLKVLAESGLVAKRREGNSIFYSRAIPVLNNELGLLHQQLLIAIDTLSLSENVSERVQNIRYSRIVQSQQFFEQQSDKFKEQQDLIAEYPVYGAAVAELLIKTSIPSRGLAVEVGPGAGEFLPELAQQFEQVIALDNAATMLQKAIAYCSPKNLKNIIFAEGDTKELLSYSKKVDCVVMNMVLHHTPSPADVFVDIASCLKPGGVLLITDLCRHDQDWAKTACGDIWLGFDGRELQRWATLAGLTKGHSNFLALRNGFQIQLQQFFK